MRAVDVPPAMGERGAILNRDRAMPKRVATTRIGLTAALAIAAAFALGARPGVAQTQPGPAGARTAPAATAPEPLVQSRVRKARPKTRVRARPQIRVQPRYPYRRWHSPYPVPYTYEFPGPSAKRQCVTRYVTERRPSGPVVVPRMRCWWVRG
jgi:hypothetical protein